MKALQKAIAAVTCLLAAATAHADCVGLLEEALETDLELSHEAFDQTPGQGFRALESKKCYREAADLIEAYITANDADQPSLTWHVAQLRAMHGDYASAITHARQSLRPAEEQAAHPLRWNDYVLAVVAFLEGDRPRFDHHRELVASSVDNHFGNAMNLQVLDNLRDGFGKPYADAMQ